MSNKSEPVALTDAQIISIIDKSHLTEEQFKECTGTSWKDGIDIAVPRQWVRNLANNIRRYFVLPQDTHPAPALTAELKAELLEALNAAMRSGRKAGWWDSNEITMDKIQAAIAKLNNMECGS